MPEVWKEKQSLWKDLSQFRTQVADTVLNSCTCWMSSSNYQTRTMQDNPLAKVCHPHDQRWSVIGLPAASDFTYLRKNEALLQHCGQWQQKVLTVRSWLPVFASGCWTNRSCSHSMGLVCTNWRELRSAATQLVWQEGPNTMQRNSLPLNSPLACVSGVEVKSLIHQSLKNHIPKTKHLRKFLPLVLVWWCLAVHRLGDVWCSTHSTPMVS